MDEEQARFLINALHEIRDELIDMNNSLNAIVAAPIMNYAPPD